MRRVPDEGGTYRGREGRGRVGRLDDPIIE